jgi:hypothetical protein
MKNILLLITSFFLVYSAYSQDSSDIFDYGTSENNIYTNSYFKLKITVPPTWTIHSKGQADTIVSKGINKITHKNPSLKPVFKIKDIKDATLLMANEYKIGIPGEFNPGISIVAENIIKAPKIKTGEDYLVEVKKLLYMTNLNYKLKRISKEKINGNVFYKLNAEINNSSIKIKQTYYSTITKGFGLSIIISYYTNKQKRELLKILNSLQIYE